MSDRDRDEAASQPSSHKDKETPDRGTNVDPPGERVDDEVASDEPKTTKRQE